MKQLSMNQIQKLESEIKIAISCTPCDRLVEGLKKIFMRLLEEVEGEDRFQEVVSECDNNLQEEVK